LKQARNTSISRIRTEKAGSTAAIAKCERDRSDVVDPKQVGWMIGAITDQLGEVRTLPR
jgi:hypothetical protein